MVTGGRPRVVSRASGGSWDCRWESVVRGATKKATGRTRSTEVQKSLEWPEALASKHQLTWPLGMIFIAKWVVIVCGWSGGSGVNHTSDVTLIGLSSVWICPAGYPQPQLLIRCILKVLIVALHLKRLWFNWPVVRTKLWYDFSVHWRELMCNSDRELSVRWKEDKLGIWTELGFIPVLLVVGGVWARS